MRVLPLTVVVSVCVCVCVCVTLFTAKMDLYPMSKQNLAMIAVNINKLAFQVVLFQQGDNQALYE